MKPNRRALTALEKGLYAMKLFHSWRQVEMNAPPGSRIDLQAADKARRYAKEAHKNFDAVRAALGADLEGDAPQPKRHWDVGA